MFYATQIKSIDTGGVIDTQGKRLTFIGYLPVKVGDTVYTDGSVIFGNAPPKGSPTVPDQPSGIPISGDDLSCYFTRFGKYKKLYSIAKDDWIVNSKLKFTHGKNALYEVEIIDADITDDGGETIVTKGFYQETNTVETTNVAFWAKDNRIWGRYIPVYGPFVYEQILGSDKFENENSPVRIFSKGELRESFSLAPYAKDVEARALIAAQKIMLADYTKDDVYPYITPEYLTQISLDTYGYVKPDFAPDTIHGWGSINEVAKPPPNSPVITYTTAYILTGNVHEQDFSGIVFASTYGYCFPHIQTRLFTGYLYDGYVSITNSIKAIREWKCVPFGYTCLYAIGANDVQPLAFRDFGGVHSPILVIDVNDGRLTHTVMGAHSGLLTSIMQARTLILQTGFETQEWETLLPVGDGFYKMNKFGQLAFYNSKKHKVVDKIPVHEDFCHIEIEHAKFHFSDFRFNDTPSYLNYNIYTPDGNTEHKILALVTMKNTYVVHDQEGNEIGTISDVKDETLPPVDGYYVRKDENTLEPLHFTPLFYELKDGSYLFGVKGGKLYHKTKDDLTIVGNGIKNFRLRELKNISKAKR